MRSASLTLLLFAVFSHPTSTSAQARSDWRSELTQPQDYVLKRASSFDRSGGNADFGQIAPGKALTILDVDGPATITHLWITLSSPEAYHVKKLVLRMSWDHETTPSG